MLAKTRNRAVVEMTLLKEEMKESELSKFKLYYEYINTFGGILGELRKLLK